MKQQQHAITTDVAPSPTREVNLTLCLLFCSSSHAPYHLHHRSMCPVC